MCSLTKLPRAIAGLVKSWSLEPFVRKSVAQGAELITFRGTSGPANPQTRSIVPCAIFKSSVSSAQLKAMKTCWEAFMETSAWTSAPAVQDRPDYRQKEMFFRMCDQVPPVSSNGGCFKKLAPQACCEWWQQLAKNYKSFYSMLESRCAKLKYDTTKGKQFVFLAKKTFQDNLFSYVTLQQREWPEQRRETTARKRGSVTFKPGTWHADGGPSTICDRPI